MENHPEEFAFLVAQAGPLNGQRWPIQSELVVGRETTCDIIVADRQVSRRHARFFPHLDGIAVEDLGSKNGTLLNGKPLSQLAALNDGDLIQVAFAQQFIFLSSDATLPLKEIAQATPAPPPSTNLPLSIDKPSHRVWVGGKEVLPPLSASQFVLLSILYEQRGRVVPRSELILKIWAGEQALDVSEQALDALIRRLRERLSDCDPTATAFITTIRGHGMRLDL